MSSLTGAAPLDIRNSIDRLKALLHTPHPHKHNFQKSEVEALTQFAFNLLYNEDFKLTETSKSELRKFKQSLLIIANPKASLKKRKLVLRKKGLANLLIKLVVPKIEPHVKRQSFQTY